MMVPDQQQGMGTGTNIGPDGISNMKKKKDFLYDV